MTLREQLGRVAYNSYCETRGWKSFRGEALPTWQDAPVDIRESWVKSADSVRHMITAMIDKFFDEKVG